MGVRGGLRVFAALVLFLAVLTWGTKTCLYHLNRYLDPPQPIRAVEFRRLDQEHLYASFLGFDLILAVPCDFPAWSPPTEPLPNPPDKSLIPFIIH
jgi:hypothetical protein